MFRLTFSGLLEEALFFYHRSASDIRAFAKPHSLHLERCRPCTQRETPQESLAQDLPPGWDRAVDDDGAVVLSTGVVAMTDVAAATNAVAMSGDERPRAATSGNATSGDERRRAATSGDERRCP